MHTIKVNDTVTLHLTAKEVDDLHDRLTTLYNDNYEQISKDKENEY